jgi:ATP adenylyltransferase
MSHDALWAPWRLVYLQELTRRTEALGAARDEAATTGPFLSEYFRAPQRDLEHHVVCRNRHGLILLNRYPYASGHLLVALGEPRPTLLEYEPAQRAEFWKLVERGTELIERALHPQGINTGINQGTAAGAGLPGHLHAHLVPRWHADTNFISIVGQVRVIPEALEIMADRYRATARELGF